MENLIYLDSALLIRSVILGFLFGLFFEVFRFLRLAFPHPTLLVAVEDLVFFLPVTVTFLLFTFAFSDGVVRYFSVLGCFFGFFLYLGTLGKLLRFFSDGILSFIRGFLRFVYRKLLLPPAIVFKNITISLFTKLHKRFIIKKEQIRSKKIKKDKEVLLRSARQGFVRRR